MNLTGKLSARATRYATAAGEACLQIAGVPRPKALLLLGHMRSGSSLLLHLLLTNPEVAALGERNATYASRADLVRLLVATRIARGSKLRQVRYVADQVNHNKFTPNPQLLQNPQVRVLFLLREPQASIASLLELSRAFYQDSWSVARAVGYYTERLEFLMRLGESLPGATGAALVEYKTLTQLPDATLEALRIFLGLHLGFSQTYDIHAFTGERGDPGPNIAAGKIVRTQPRAAIALSTSELATARDAYVRCRASLARLALTSAPMLVREGSDV